MKKLLLAGVAVLPLLTGTPSQAQVLSTNRHGDWMTSMSINTQDRIMCSADLRGSDGSMSFDIKWEVGKDTPPKGRVFFHLYKAGWHIPDDTTVKVEMQVDNAPSAIFPMQAVNSTDPKSTFNRGTYLQFMFTDQVNPDTGKEYGVEFMELVETGLKVKFFFPQGNEIPWMGSLTGSSAALADMGACMQAVDMEIAKHRGGKENVMQQPYNPRPRQLPDTQRTQPFIEG